jgi:hypothetical protein
MKVERALQAHSKLLRETDVAFNHVVHIENSVAEHQGPLDTHAEGKT